jgi:hypothetical protein
MVTAVPCVKSDRFVQTLRAGLRVDELARQFDLAESAEQADPPFVQCIDQGE